MKSPLIILVVEDDDKHFAHFAEAFAFVQAQMTIEMSYVRAANLKEAYALAPDCDACITDAIFPRLAGNEPTDLGHMLANEFLEQKKGVVVCTSGWHHGTDIIETIRVQNRGVKMFDCEPNRTVRGCVSGILKTMVQVNSRKKPWLQAIYGLLLVQEGIEDGTFGFEDDRGERVLLESRYYDGKRDLMVLGFKFNQIVLGGLCWPKWDAWFEHFKNSPGELEECQRYQALVERVTALGVRPPADMRWTVTEE